MLRNELRLQQNTMNNFLQSVKAEITLLETRLGFLQKIRESYEDSAVFDDRSPRKKKPSSETSGKKSGKGHGVPTCKNCGAIGHRSNSLVCPKRNAGRPTKVAKPKQPEDDEDGDDDVDNGIDDFTPEEEESSVQKVTRLKEEGLDSIQIAARLKTTLKKVNEAW
jgi:hypothetical protein